MSRGPVLVIGLDGGTMDVIGPLAEHGVMPSFARLIASGRAGTLRSTIPWYTIPGWASLITGVSPATHGLLHWVTSGDDEYFEGWRSGRRFVTSRDIGHPTIWDVAGAADKRVAVVNMPLTYPAWPVNGTMITGLLTPQGAKDGCCHPADLLDRFPDYGVDVSRADAIDLLDEPGSEATELGSYLRQLVEITQERARVGTALLSEGVDLGVVVFVGPDRISHKAWSEQSSVARNGTSRGEIEELIEAYYRTLDRAVADLMRAMGSQATVLVVADHGFGPPPTHRLRVNAWLQQTGHLKLRAARAQRVIASSRRMRRLVRRVLRGLKRRRIRVSQRALVDWAASDAYAVAYPSTATFGVIVNRVGVKQEGSVSPEDAPVVLARLRDDLASLVDERGRSVVRRIWGRDELGGTAPGSPDLIVEVEGSILPYDGLLSAGVFEPYDEPSGIHERAGVLIASGPGVRGDGPIDADIVDIAPSVLALLGIDAPSSMEGKAQGDFLDLAEVVPPPAEVAGPGGSAPDMSAEEEREIEAHLRALGYEE